MVESILPSPLRRVLAVRGQNKIGPRLTASRCLFEVSLGAIATSQELEGDEFLKAFRTVGGEVYCETISERSTLNLEINHGLMDAFGGLFSLSSSPFTRRSLASYDAVIGESRFEKRGVAVQHLWHAGNSQPKVLGLGTFTQQFFAKLLTKVSDLDSLDVCVACDDLRQMSVDDIYGNSLGIAKLRRNRLNAISTWSRSQWGEFLHKRAMHSQELPTDKEEAGPSKVLVSSLGDLGKMPWVLKSLTPQNFWMFPTPIPGALNVVLWSNQGTQALTFGYYKDDAPLMKAIEVAVATSWKEMVM